MLASGRMNLSFSQYEPVASGANRDISVTYPPASRRINGSEGMKVY
jgi:hypothetical protein